jgi:hypothetical protein
VKDYLKLSLSGAVLGMIGFFLPVVDRWYHKKEMVYVGIALVALAWLLVFVGMIIGADFVSILFELSTITQVQIHSRATLSRCGSSTRS